MKLLVVSNLYPDEAHPAYGTFVARFCEQLDTLGVDYDKVVMHQSNGKLRKAWGYVRFYSASFFACLSRKYDTVYVHYASHSAPGVLLAGKFRKFRLITNAHGSDVDPQTPTQEKFQIFTRKLIARSDSVVVPSAYFQSHVAEKYGYPIERIFVYPSGGVGYFFFCEPGAKAGEASLRRFGLREDAFRVGFAGRLAKIKGWDTFVEAAALLKEEFPNFQFIMVGSGAGEAGLEAMRKERNLNLIRFPLLDPKSLAELYSCLDVFAFPTRGESLGLVGLEAMAGGAAVVAGDCTAPRYYIRHGVNGLKFPPGDAKALAEAIKTYYLLPEEKKQQVLAQGYQTALAYAPDKILNQLETILKES